MQALQGRKSGDGFHTGIGDMWCAEAELFQRGQFLEMQQTSVSEFGVGKIENAEGMEAGDFGECIVIDAAAAVAKMFESLTIRQATESQSRQAAAFVVH